MPAFTTRLPEYKRIGIAARAIRLSRGLEQAELGEMIGFTATTVRRLEMGDKQMSMATVAAIISGLETTFAKVMKIADLL